MNRRSQFAILGIGLLLGSCAASPQSHQSETTGSSTAQGAPTAAFSNPVVKPASVGAAAVPGLLQPTSAKARVPNIATGRSDPFAQVNPGLISASTTRVSPPANRAPAPNRSPALNLPPLPSVQTGLPNRSNPAPFQPVGRAPTFSPLPLPPGALSAPPIARGTEATGLPPLAVPPVSKTALADAIEVTGAVQVQGQWQIIVKEPDSASRYVKVGEALANGQVIVKRVIENAGSDPIVVLQQNGKEVTRPIGSRPAIASAQ